MIHDHLAHQALYRHLHPRIARVFDFLSSFEEETPDGRILLEGEDLVAMIQTYETRDPLAKKMESHRRYVDLQYVVSGEEKIFHCPTDILVPKEGYHEDRDVEFYQDRDEQSFILRRGQFAIFFQHDGHKPSCIHDKPQTVKKIVFKIKL